MGRKRGRDVSKKRPSFDSETKGRKLYLVSGDLRHLFQKWAQNMKFETPSKAFFKKLRRAFLRKLQDILGVDVKVVYLPWDDIATRMLKFIKAEADGLLVVSLDPVYAVDGVDVSIQASRIMKHSKHAEEKGTPEKEWEIIGYGPRPGERPMSVQLLAVKHRAEELRTVFHGQ